MAFAPEPVRTPNLMHGWKVKWVYVVDSSEEGLPEGPRVFLEEAAARAEFDGSVRRLGGQRVKLTEGGSEAVCARAVVSGGDKVELWKVARPVSCGGVAFVVQNRGSKNQPPMVFGDRPTAVRHYQNAASFELGCLAEGVAEPAPNASWACEGDRRAGREVWFWSARVVWPEVKAPRGTGSDAGTRQGWRARRLPYDGESSFFADMAVGHGELDWVVGADRSGNELPKTSAPSPARVSRHGRLD